MSGMSKASETLHEEGLPAEVIDRHRAIVSIMEELEAVDWYDQRVAATSDGELAEVLAHSRDEEKEHAAMTLEWLRRRDPELDRMLRTYLFTDGSVLEVEQDDTGEAPAPGGDHSLGIGSLRSLTSSGVTAGGVR
jgi:uncharacterized protein